jgi:Carbohydrate binding domain
VNKFFKLPFLAAAAAIPAALMVLGANAATNLLTNPNFDTNTSGWTIKAGWPTGTMAWDAGTLKLTNTMDPTVTSATAATECIDGITPGTAYTLKADAMVPSGQKRHGGAQTRIFWYQGAGCTGAVLTTPQGSTFVITLDKWVTSKDDFVAPATAKSGQVMLMTEMYKADVGEDATAHFYAKWDNASFTVAPVATPTPASTPTKTPTSVPTTTTTPPTATGTPVIPQIPGDTRPADDTDVPADQGSNDATAGQQPGATSTPEQVPGNPGSGEIVNTLGDTNTVTPVIAKHSGESPLAPSTGSGQHGQPGGLIDWRIFLLGMLALVAVSGLVVTVGSVVRSGRDPEEF